MSKEALTLREIQLETLKNMTKIAEICEKENINYCLAYGSLIGAIRHKGFIPWDDDLDIWMPRPDYERFKQYCLVHKDELQPFELFTPETHIDYPNMIGRFCNTDFSMEVENEKPSTMGTFVDIYPMDGIGSDINYINRKAKWIKLPASCYFMVSRKKFKKTERKGLNTLKFVLFIFSKIAGKQFFYKKLMSWANRFPYEESDYIGCLTWLVNSQKDIFIKTSLCNTILYPFEGCMFRIPVEYDKILTQIYGNYMELPPEEKRVGHHFYNIYRK